MDAASLGLLAAAVGRQVPYDEVLAEGLRQRLHAVHGLPLGFREHDHRTGRGGRLHLGSRSGTGMAQGLRVPVHNHPVAPDEELDHEL